MKVHYMQVAENKNLIFSNFYANQQKSCAEKKKLIKNVLLLFAMEILYSKGFRDSDSVV